MDKELLVTFHGDKNLYFWEHSGKDLFLSKQIPLNEKPYIMQSCDKTGFLYIGIANEIAIIDPKSLEVVAKIDVDSVSALCGYDAKTLLLTSAGAIIYYDLDSR